jgi:hypothetical protein
MRFKTGSGIFRNTVLSKANYVNLLNITIGNKKEVYKINFFQIIFFSKMLSFPTVTQPKEQTKILNSEFKKRNFEK